MTGRTGRTGKLLQRIDRSGEQVLEGMDMAKLLQDFHEDLRRRRFPRSLSLGVVWVAAGLLIGYQPLYSAAAFAAFALLAWVVLRPEIGALIIVVLVSSIVFEESLPLIPIGVGSLHLTDLILLLMFATLLCKSVRSAEPVFNSPLNLPLALFFSSAVFSAVLSICYWGQDFNNVFRLLRPLTYYLLFYLVTNGIRKPDQIRFLVKALFAIAAVVSITMVVQAFIGDAVILMPGRVEAASSLENSFDTLRILPPGQTLVFVFFILAISFLTMEEKGSVFRSPYLYLTAILGMGVILTYNRSYWATAFVAAALLLATGRNKVRLLAAFTVITVFLVSITVVRHAAGGGNGEFQEAVSERFLSLFAGKELKESGSLEYRYMENEYALPRIKNHPLLGIGLGNDYRPSLGGPDDNLTYYIHNGYLWLILDLGLVGFAFFVLFYAGFIVRGVKSWKLIQDRFLRSLALGCVMGGISLLLMAPVNPVFMQWFSIVVIAVIVSLTEAAIAVDGNGQRLEGARQDGRHG